VKLTRRAIAVALCLGAGAGTLVAQPETAKPAANLSLATMQQRAEALQTDVQKDLRHVRHLQEITRKQRDVIRLNCVNEKYLQLKAHANLFDKAHLELKGQTTETPAADEAFAAVEKSAVDGHNARLAADACVGEAELWEESSNLVEAPDFTDDPTAGDPFRPTIEPPAYASPFN